MNVLYYRVIAIAPFYEDNYLSFQGAQLLIGSKSKISGSKVYLLDSFNPPKSIMTNIKNTLGGNVMLETKEDYLKTSVIKNLNNLMTAIVMLLLIILFIVVGAILANFIWLSVQERIREIGTYMAIGASREKLVLIIVAEGLILSFFSSLIGVILGVISCNVVKALDIYIVFGHFLQASLLPVVSFKNVIISLLFPSLLAIIWSLIPALKITKLEPMEALRNV
jgi:ABC-type antimicrobial peptide transport system permease subunit